MNGWKPKPHVQRAPHSIWYSDVCRCWFVNVIGDDIFGDFETWQEAMDFLNDELSKASPMEVS